MTYDDFVIRPEKRFGDVKWRGAGLRGGQTAELRRNLRTLHTLEIMAATIYRCQIARTHCAVDTYLTAAMDNELTHMQDFQTMLFEYGVTPSKVRFSYWLVGYAIGLGSRTLGRTRVLQAGVWAEEKAVHHYGRLLEQYDWDPEARAVIEKNRSDEYRHIEQWKHFLSHPEEICPQ